ncbi:MAG: condensation domain-containing protein, partial [Pseudomonadota bacterium]
MSASELLASLRAAGITVEAEGGRLRVGGAAGSITPELRERLAAEKMALLDLLQAEAGPSLTPRRRDLPAPLSHFQERLWVIQQLDPGGTEYNMATAWDLGAGVAAGRLHAALGAVIARHDILRTTFHETPTHPEARVGPPDIVPISRGDLSAVAPEARFAAVGEDLDRQVRRPFELAREAPVRFGVYDCGADGAALLIVAHHIAFDHWSLALFRQALETALADPASLPEPAVQYADYAAWSRAQLTPERLGADLDWWAERLAGHPALSAFEADRAPEERAAGASVSFLWDPELSAAIHALARDQRATLYMCLVAAAAAALHVHTGQDDIVLGSPAALRERAELEGVIGPFVNTLALRLAVEPGCNFADMVARARDAVLDAHAHGAVPFEMVVDRVQPARSFNRSPLFQVAVVLQNAGAGQSAPIYGGGAVHDMTWFVREDGGQIMGAIEYRADLYDEATIRRILERIRMLLAGAVTDPTLALSRLPLLSKDERATVLAHAADAPVETDPAPFPLQFQRAAAEFGGRVAIACGDAALTYAALEARANRIAHHLRGLGIGRGAVVGLCMARSAEMVAALIGIQKAGAAYVPLDPAFPADRLAYVLEDSGAAALIADPRGLGRLSLPEGLALVDLEAAAGALDALPDTPPEDPPAPGDRSHIIYTSGSTGRPKGVAIGHAAV